MFFSYLTCIYFKIYIYSYIYQSSSTDIEGYYTAIIEVTSGGYTAVSETVFVLEEQ